VVAGAVGKTKVAVGAGTAEAIGVVEGMANPVEQPQRIRASAAEVNRLNRGWGGGDSMAGLEPDPAFGRRICLEPGGELDTVLPANGDSPRPVGLPRTEPERGTAFRAEGTTMQNCQTRPRPPVSRPRWRTDRNPRRCSRCPTPRLSARRSQPHTTYRPSP